MIQQHVIRNKTRYVAIRRVLMGAVATLCSLLSLTFLCLAIVGLFSPSMEGADSRPFDMGVLWFLIEGLLFLFCGIFFVFAWSAWEYVFPRLKELKPLLD